MSSNTFPISMPDMSSETHTKRIKQFTRSLSDKFQSMKVSSTVNSGATSASSHLFVDAVKKSVEGTLETTIANRKDISEEISLFQNIKSISNGFQAFQERYGVDLRNLSVSTGVALHYLLEDNETHLTASSKRRSHFFATSLSKEMARAFAKDLLMANLAYLDLTNDQLAHKLQIISSHCSGVLEQHNEATKKQTPNIDVFEQMMESFHMLETLEKSKNQTTSRETLETQTDLLGWLKQSLPWNETSHNGSWQILANVSEPKPKRPAHFLALFYPKKSSSDSQPGGEPQKKHEGQVEAYLVVRGTSSLEDVVTDLKFQNDKCFGGFAHSGFLSAGKWLADLYGDALKHVDKLNKENSSFFSSPVKIKIIGHSLGAGAAVLTGFCLRDTYGIDNLEVTTFGCPPVICEHLQKESEKFVTSIVCDDDVITRLTLTGVRKFVQKLREFDWTKYLERDIEALISHMRRNAPPLIALGLKDDAFKDVVKQITFSLFPTSLDDTSQISAMEECLEAREIENENCFVPGVIYHLYRTGRGFEGAQIESKELNEILFSRHFLDDHSLDTYFSALKDCWY